MTDELTDLDGRVALVTGASSGIGEATALALAEEGARLALAARRTDVLEALVDRIENEGGEALVVPTDVTDDADVEEMIETTHEAFGSLDILINNAGVMLLEPIERATAANFRQSIEVNLLGLMNATRAAVPIMREQGSGHVVNVASVSGRKASAGASAYNASKFGVVGFSEALRQELTDGDVRVTVIEPGIVDTELAEHIPDEQSKESTDERIASMEPLSGTDIARSILYALSQPPHVDVNELLVRPTQQDL
jgi:hypothetical protein